MGYAHPERAFETLRAWHEGRYRAVRGEEARERLAELLPTVLDVFAAWPDPDSALALFDGFLARLPAGSHLFSMFAAHPELFDLITEIMGSAPRLANWLEHRPMLLDSVLSREFSDLDVPGADELGPELATIARRGLVRVFYQREFGTEEMRAELADVALRARDLQDFLDSERRWANDKIFHIGVHMLRGLLFPVEAATPLSDIADACLGAALPVVANAFAETHGRVPGGRFAVVALGPPRQPGDDGDRPARPHTGLRPSAERRGIRRAQGAQARPLLRAVEPALRRRDPRGDGGGHALRRGHAATPVRQRRAHRHLARLLHRALCCRRSGLAAPGARPRARGLGPGRSGRALRAGTPRHPPPGARGAGPRRPDRGLARGLARRRSRRRHLG